MTAVCWYSCDSTGSVAVVDAACALAAVRSAADATGACPLPVRLGSDSTDNTQAATAATERAAPRLRLRRGGVVSQRERRTGRSTSTKVAVATRKLIAATDRFWASERAWPSAAGTRISMGQCHRYQE